MAHTLPDYTTKYKMSKIFGNADNAELAARLGSPLTYDRRGNVVWMDDFENGIIHWKKQSVAAPGSIESYVGHSYMGSTSMCQITSGTGADSVYAEKWFPLLYSSSIGIETMVNFSGTDVYIDLSFWGYSGTERFISVARWIPELHTIQYRDNGGGFQTLSTAIGGGTYGTSWMPLKLVVDHSTGYYKRILIGNDEFDCSTFEMQRIADARDGYLTARMLTYEQAAAQKTVYFDNVIITQNED